MRETTETIQNTHKNKPPTAVQHRKYRKNKLSDFRHDATEWDFVTCCENTLPRDCQVFSTETSYISKILLLLRMIKTINCHY